MRVIAVITMPDELAERWRSGVGAYDLDELATAYFDEAITDKLASEISGAEDGDRHEAVRDQIDVSVLPSGGA